MQTDFSIQARDTSLYANMALPHLCSDLARAGLTHETIFFWKITLGNISLETFAFDPDKYYLEGNRLVEDVMHTFAHLVPAYSLKDLERCLPTRDYALYMEDAIYCLTFDMGKLTYKYTAERMPDVFAEAVINMLKLGKLNLLVCEHIITGK